MCWKNTSLSPFFYRLGLEKHSYPSLSSFVTLSKSLTIHIAVLWTLQLSACFSQGGIQDCMMCINWSTRVKIMARQKAYTKQAYTQYYYSLLKFFVAFPSCRVLDDIWKIRSRVKTTFCSNICNHTANITGSLT